MKGDVYIKLIRFFHGPFLSAVVRAFDIEDTPDNKSMVKEIIKKQCEIGSMADLTAVEIGEVITEVALIFAVEVGEMLPFPGEPDNIGELSMGEFMSLKKKS